MSWAVWALVGLLLGHMCTHPSDGAIIGFGERDLTGQRLAFHSLPMFHGLGMMQIGWTVCAHLWGHPPHAHSAVGI